MEFRQTCRHERPVPSGVRVQVPLSAQTELMADHSPPEAPGPQTYASAPVGYLAHVAEWYTR